MISAQEARNLSQASPELTKQILANLEQEIRKAAGMGRTELVFDSPDLNYEGGGFTTLPVISPLMIRVADILINQGFRAEFKRYEDRQQRQESSTTAPAVVISGVEYPSAFENKVVFKLWVKW